MDKFDPKKPTEIRSKVYTAKNKKELRFVLHDVLSEINGILSAWQDKHKDENINDFFEELYKFFESLSSGWKKYNKLVCDMWKVQKFENIDYTLLDLSEDFLKSVIKGEIPINYVDLISDLPLLLEKYNKIDERVSVMDIFANPDLSLSEPDWWYGRHHSSEMEKLAAWNKFRKKRGAID